MQKSKRRKGDPSTGGPCGSWVPAPKVKASTAWKIHTPKSAWFGPVTVTKVVGA